MGFPQAITVLVIVSAAVAADDTHARSDDPLETFAARISDRTVVKEGLPSAFEEHNSAAALKNLVLEMSDGDAAIEVRSQMVGNAGWTAITGPHQSVLCSYADHGEADACFVYDFFSYPMRCLPVEIGFSSLIACTIVEGKGTGFFASGMAVFTSPPHGGELDLIAVLPVYTYFADADGVTTVRMRDDLDPLRPDDAEGPEFRRCAEVLVEPYDFGESRRLEAPECETYNFDEENRAFVHISGPNSVADGLDQYFELAEP